MKKELTRKLKSLLEKFMNGYTTGKETDRESSNRFFIGAENKGWSEDIKSCPLPD